MRKLIYSQMVSVDGFVEGPNGELDWSEPGEQLHKHFNDLYLSGEIDTSIYGRKLYEIMASYWPDRENDPSAPDVEIEFSRVWKETPKLVFSNTLDEVKWNSKLVREINPEEINKLKHQNGNDIDVGGAELASAFMEQNLIDEYRLYIHPVILGNGKQMFPVLKQDRKLHFTTSQNFECGVVLLCYKALKS